MGISQLDQQGHTRMKTFLVFALALTATQALNIDQQWEIFKAKYQRNFLSTPEHDNRKSVFTSNLKLIAKHNAEHALGLHTYTLGVNQFASRSSSTTEESTTPRSAHPQGWTTVLLWWDMGLKTTRTTGWSRTRGAHPGARRATSRCPGTGTTTAELPPWPSTPPLKPLHHQRSLI